MLGGAAVIVMGSVVACTTVTGGSGRVDGAEAPAAGDDEDAVAGMTYEQLQQLQALPEAEPSMLEGLVGGLMGGR